MKLCNITLNENHIIISILFVKIKIKFNIFQLSNYDKLRLFCDIKDLDKLLEKGLICDHPMSIFVHYKSFGYNNRIYQNVTIGAKNGNKSDFPDGYPVIGNNIVVYAGAVIVGNIEVGDNSVIAANSVVINDVPPNSVVAGCPAKVIKQLK